MTRAGLRSSAIKAKPQVAAVAWWQYAIALAAAAWLLFTVYAPALTGPFLFDDLYLPFNLPGFAERPLANWVAGVRPLLMFSFWLNYQVSGLDTFSYHAFNVAFHMLNSVLLFLIVRRLLATVARRELLAAFAGFLFLLHPIQTESVAYVASRSEILSALFFLAALAVFLYRRAPEITWPISVCVLGWFAAAVSTKEHTVVLLALLLLTDYFWNPGFSFIGIRRNWRLYLPILGGAVLASVWVLRVLRTSASAGAAIKEFTWYQYFFTECRAFFEYLRLFFFPSGQRVDYDFPISRTLFDHGAFVALLGILALIAVAIYLRRQWPLICYGALAFGLLLAPTSSFIPIKDPIAEHRLYLPMLGLLLVVVGVLGQIRIGQTALVALLIGIILIAAMTTHRRNQVWGSAIALWEDTARKSPRKGRAHFQLASAFFHEGRCEDAIREYEMAARLEKPDYGLLVDCGLAYDCAHRPDEALAKLRQAAMLEPTAHVYSQIGMVLAKAGRSAEALKALDQALRLDPNFDVTYAYRGNVHAALGEFTQAAADYRHALALNPGNQMALSGLPAVERQLSRRR